MRGADRQAAHVAQEPPAFTLAQLRAAVPPHCFQRSLLRSSAYLACDVVMAVSLYLAVRAADAQPMPLAARVLLWLAYTIAQGSVCTGIWVVAHECGHGAFSDYPLVNDSVGLVFHSALLVPYVRALALRYISRLAGAC
jgi:omega-6 fatty acid desaturase (delta-12 desaturase)